MARDHLSTSVKSERPEGMKAPKDPGEKHMGGDKKGHDGMKAHMGRAVEHLERETERGAHCATVAGHKMHGHSGSMKGHKE